MTQRDDILDCACELYLHEGLDGLKMRRLAEEVGVTPGALYRHYEGKDEVLLDLVGRAHETLLRYLMRALEGDGPAERMRKAEEAYLDFALRERRMYEVYYATPDLIGIDELPDETARRARSIRQFWQDRVAECVDAGLLRETAAWELGLALWSHAHGLLSLYHRGLIEMDEGAFRETFFRSRLLALRGVAREEAYGRLERVWTEGGGALKRDPLPDP